MVYKNFVVHPDTATVAHKAACAAGKQGKFMEFQTLFWEKGFGEYVRTRDPSVMGREAVDKMAAELGLDMKKFAGDLEGAECAERLKRDMQELSKFGVNATPSFFVNGRFTMFSSRAQLEQIIEDELARVEKSGVPPGEYYQSVVMTKGLEKFRSKADAAKNN